MDPIQGGDVIPLIPWEFIEFIDDNGVTVPPVAGDMHGPPGPAPPLPGIPDIPVDGAETLEPIGIDADVIMFEPNDWTDGEYPDMFMPDIVYDMDGLIVELIFE